MSVWRELFDYNIYFQFQKEVYIYRLFTSGAIEDHAFRLQTFKQGIAKSAMEQANQKTSVAYSTFITFLCGTPISLLFD